MRLLPFTAPRIGVAIRADRITLVRLTRGWRSLGGRPRIVCLRERPLPDGLVRPSWSELNLSDPDRLAEELHGAVDREGPLPVALSLPDLAARTLLLDFESLPSKSAECEALIRWRLEKELAISPALGRLAYRIYRLEPSPRQAIPARVLAVFVRRAIVEQYEQACERAGLLPVRTVFGAMPLLDLCGRAVDAGRRRSASREVEDAFVVSVADDAWVLIAVRNGIPQFLRIRSRRRRASGLPPLPSAGDELVATVQFYDERHPAPSSPSPRRLLVLGRHDPGLTPAQQTLLGVTVLPVSAPRLPTFQGAAPPPAASSAAAALLASTASADLALSAGGFGLLRALQAAMVIAILCAIVLAGWSWEEGRRIEQQALGQEHATRRVQEANARFLTAAARAGHDLRPERVTSLPQQVSFANQLLQNGAFSWTRFLGDLEEAIAPRVSFSSVKLTFKDSTITLQGSALALKDITAQIDKLEAHPSFRNVVLAQHRFREDKGPRQGDDPVRVRRTPRESVDFTMSVVYERSRP